jgi:3-phosphoshikimate 1-carboxyvinyltransferase
MVEGNSPLPEHLIMKASVRPSRLKGIVQAPASKSSMQRACAAALLHKGNSLILNPGHSNDDKAALNIIQHLGALLEKEDNAWSVASNGVSPVSDGIDCGESGLSIRMFTPLAALSEKQITINGSGSLVTRPMDFFDEILPKLGVSVRSRKGKLPIVVQGPLKPATIEVDGSLSSQYLTGLIMAYSAAGAQGVSIYVKNLKSKPYIDLTLDVMTEFGMKVPLNRDYEEFYFPGDETVRLSTPVAGHSTPSYTVEGDWSGGAFLLVAAAIAGPVTIRGLDLTSSQADRAIVDGLMAADAGIAIEAKGIAVHPGNLSGFEFDATDCPDLFPPLVALAAYASGETRIKGVSRLAHKESDRAITLQEEFGKMGVKVALDGDMMIIEGGTGVTGTAVHSRHDHRIAMACAVAALGANGDMIIEEAQAVQKSYPDFYDDLKRMGATVSLDNKFTLHE